MIAILVGKDFNKVDVTVTFPSNTSSGDLAAQQCFSLTSGTHIIDDVYVESTETLVCEATSADPGVVFIGVDSGNTATINILDDDGEFLLLK